MMVKAAKPTRYRIRVVAGPDAGTVAELDRGGLVVGRDPSVNLVLSDTQVSRFHLDITVTDDGLRVTDLDSQNGTFHGDTRIGRVTFADDAMLTLGRTELAVTAVDGRGRGDGDEPRFGRALGAAPAMRELFALLDHVAPKDLAVLFEGESGTGKEVLAEAVHARSGRAGKPLVVVDCGTLPRTLIGAELFGHARGAFTGAIADKAGLIEEADGGTLFIDEIGELPLDLQSHLLRALEKHEVRRIGETQPRRVDVRIIAATNKSLQQMVQRGTFRADLFFRLAVVRARVPALRERKEDIPLLARAFLREHGSDPSRLPPGTLDRLLGYDWPGNVRELRNAVARAVWIDDPFPPVGATEVRTPGLGNVLARPFKEAKGMLVESFERRYVSSLLARHGGNLSRAARASGIERNCLRRMAHKLDVDYTRVRA